MVPPRRRPRKPQSNRFLPCRVQPRWRGISSRASGWRRGDRQEGLHAHHRKRLGNHGPGPGDHGHCVAVRAANVDATSTIETVTVYPDGATVTRVISSDLASGDSTLVAKDFPLSLDPSSLRVEGEAGAKLTIGTIDARPPKAAPPANLSGLDKRIEALRDQRADLQVRSTRPTRGASLRSTLPKPRRPASARRARRARLPNGARPLRRLPRRSRPRTPQFAMPRENSARSIARSPNWKPSARPSRPACWRCGSTWHRPPRPRRRCA